MSLSPERLEVVAVDDGYDFTKTLTRTKGARIPTSVSLTLSNMAKVMQDEGKAVETETVFEIDGIEYAVGPDVVAAMETRFDDFPYHPANLAVAMDAMRRVVAPGTPVHVVVGVPVSRYYLNGEIDETVKTRKSVAWNKTVKMRNGPVLPRICKVSVLSEAVAAWFDFVIDERFQERQHLINDFMAVVDIGGRTTDIAVFKNAMIDLDLSDTMDSGMLEVQKSIKKILSGKYRGSKFPRSLIIEAVNTGYVTLGNGRLDISEDVIKERRRLVAKIEDFMISQLGSEMPFLKRVLFVGGGAHALQFDLKARFPNAFFAADPQMANARGMLKYGVVSDSYEEAAVVNG